jgi:hypothetical protein
VSDRPLVEVLGLEPGDRSVLVLRDEKGVEHADDAAVDKVEQQRCRLAGHRSAGGIADDDDVDGAELVVVGGG